eukprot:1425985-Amphidinium_carterae.1
MFSDLELWDSTQTHLLVIPLAVVEEAVPRAEREGVTVGSTDVKDTNAKQAKWQPAVRKELKKSLEGWTLRCVTVGELSDTSTSDQKPPHRPTFIFCALMACFQS